MLRLSSIAPSTWRATFWSAPMLSSDGFGAATTPWRAVQLAAWEALGKAHREVQQRSTEDGILP